MVRSKPRHRIPTPRFGGDTTAYIAKMNVFVPTTHTTSQSRPARATARRSLSRLGAHRGGRRSAGLVSRRGAGRAILRTPQDGTGRLGARARPAGCDLVWYFAPSKFDPGSAAGDTYRRQPRLSPRTHAALSTNVPPRAIDYASAPSPLPPGARVETKTGSTDSVPANCTQTHLKRGLGARPLGMQAFQFECAVCVAKAHNDALQCLMQQHGS